MFKDYKFLCNKLNINFKKDIIITSSLATLGIILGTVSIFIYSFIIGVLLIIVGLAYFVSHYRYLKSKVKELANTKEIAFNAFYRYVITLLKNGHVLYSALQASIEYIDEVLIDDVKTLINDIAEDTSMNPFIKFSNEFYDENVKQMIILLYKTSDSNALDSVLNSIDECMINLQDNSIHTYLNKEEKSIERYYIYPIILSAAVMLLVSFYVFSLIGSGTYV